MTDHNMSMSLMVDDTQSKTITIPARTPNVWVPDRKVSTCYNCSTHFNLFRRRHHCRRCGRVFCYACCNIIDFIPSYVPTALSFGKHSTIRSCHTCYEHIQEQILLHKYIYLFANIPIPIADWLFLRQICHTWKKAIEYDISLFRNIQYKLSFLPWSKIIS